MCGKKARCLNDQKLSPRSRIRFRGRFRITLSSIHPADPLINSNTAHERELFEGFFIF